MSCLLRNLPWVTAVLLAGGVLAQETDCTPLSWGRDTMAVEVSVQKPGKYCLAQDLKQRSAIDIAEGFRERGGPARIVSFIFAGVHDAELDLGGHLITSKPFLDAVGVEIMSASNIADMNGRRHLNGQIYDFPQNLLLRNGRIRMPGKNGVGVYLGFNKDWRIIAGTYAPAYDRLDEDDVTMSRQAPWVSGKAIRFDVPWNYQPATNFRLEALDIQAGGRGVVMTGAGNVLRDSLIEVDSDTAVYLFGPGSVVENNTIIVNMKPAVPARLPAALKLRDADGATIRNNRIIVRGAAKDADVAAINLLASKDVVIENNRFEGTSQLLRKDEASTVSLSGNETFVSEKKTLFDFLRQKD